MGIEIERKFLVDKAKWQQADRSDATVYLQAYLVHNDRVTIRVRTSHKEGFITFKSSSGGRSRKEYEYPVPLQDAKEMMQNFAGNLVEKTRYRVLFAGKTWEVDEFSGDNAGLIIAEIELGDEEESISLPDWISTEVTDDPRYYNAYLSAHPYRSWQSL